VPGLKTEVAFSAVAAPDPRVDLIEYFATPGDVGIEKDQTTMSVALASKLSDTMALTAGYQVSPSSQFGAVSELESHNDFGTSSFLSGQSFDSVLSGFSQQADTLSVSYAPTNKKTSMKLGLVSVDQPGRYNQDSISTILQGNYQFTDNAGLSLQFGQIEEKGSVLGGGGDGVFGVENANTYALNLSGKLKATEKFSIVANYGIGRTTVESSDSSLLKDFSTLKSDWYSLGLLGNNLIRERDQFGVAFSQPLKIHSGEVDYSIPSHRLANGDIGFDTERVNLSETNATERNLEAYYRTMLGDKMEMGGFISYRQNPNHVSDHGDDTIFMATLRYWQ